MTQYSFAIFGTGGSLGQSFVDALQSPLFSHNIKYPIKAFSRSKKASTDKIQYFDTDLSDTKAVAEQIANTDVVIELISPNPSVYAQIEEILSVVKPLVFFPSQFGMDIATVDKLLPGFLLVKTQHADNVRKLGIKTVLVITGQFAVPNAFLYELVGAVGIDTEQKTLTQRGAPSTRIAYSKPGDIAKSVVSAATAGDFGRLPDSLYIQSGEITFKDVVDRYEKSHGVSLKTVSAQLNEDVVKELQELWKNEGFVGEKFFYYLNALGAAGIKGGLLFEKNDDELVNPEQKLWRWESF